MSISKDFHFRNGDHRGSDHPSDLEEGHKFSNSPGPKVSLGNYSNVVWRYSYLPSNKWESRPTKKRKEIGNRFTAKDRRKLLS